MKATPSHYRTERKRVKTEKESRAADAEAALDRRTETGGRIQVALSLVEDNREPERPAWRRHEQEVRLQQSQKKRSEILEGVRAFGSAPSKYSALLPKSGGGGDM